MAGHKETPRQKMIGMMYLVLTALLALNVSADILNAFTIVNEGMVQTNDNFEAKNNMLYAQFQKQYELNKAKVGPYYQTALKAQKYSQDLINIIKDVQNKVIGYTELGTELKEPVIYDFPFEFENKQGESVDTIIHEPRDLELEWIHQKANFDKPMNIMLGVGNEDGTGGEATRLKEAFEQYKKDILSLLGKEQADGIKLGLNTEGHFNKHAGKYQNWEMNTFYHTVLSADVVLLNKYIAEVMNIEAEVVAKLYENIDASSFKFDVVESALIPKANIVIAGEPYEAKIFIAAYSSTDTPQVLIQKDIDTLYSKGFDNALKLDSISEGVTYYKVPTSSVGDYKYAGVIRVKKPDGGYLTKHFTSSYTVIKPSASVSADKMNVVYRGLNNPLTIAATGFTNIKLVSSGGGSLTSKGNSKYMFKPSLGKAQKVTFRVVATKDDGTTTSMGPFEFRIRNLPAPVTRLAGKSEGTIRKGALTTQPTLLSQLDNFLFDGVKYTVISYEVMVMGRGIAASPKRVRGSRLPADVLKIIKKAGKGTLIVVNNVKVKGPDGVKGASGVTLKLN
jgi:gliding motility-associated protein GldM